MQQYMSTYKVTLETKGPLYIGSGKQLGKKEYIHNRQKKEIVVPNLIKMYQQLKKKNLTGEYEKFLLNPKEKDLYMWLVNKGITYAESKKWAEYSFDCSDAVLDRNTKEISLFVKDVYGKPFVPGSSLKGALRTILCVDELVHDKKKLSQVQGMIESGLRKPGGGKKYLQREIKQIEVDVFHTLNIKDISKMNAVQDVMKGMIISDSKPLKISDLTLCQKIDVDTSGKRTRIQMLRECIKPGTKIEFELTVDESINTYYDETILDAINHFLESYYHFLNGFGPVNEEQDILYLGGGTGFAMKTILYGIFSKKDAVRVISKIFDKTISRKKNEKPQHINDIRLGVSPHIKKCTEYAGREYEFGKCKVYIEEI